MSWCIILILIIGKKQNKTDIDILLLSTSCFFKQNKCNMGYAFINMIDPLQIVPFYKV